MNSVNGLTVEAMGLFDWFKGTPSNVTVLDDKIWLATVEVGGRHVPRFQYVGSGGSGAIPQNLFADIPSTLPQELFQTLAEAANVRIERIVSHGHAHRALGLLDEQLANTILKFCDEKLGDE